MDRQTRIFAWILLLWLLLLDGAIIKTVYERASIDSIVYTKNVVTGNAISYSASSQALFYKVLIPILIFNIFVVLFFSLSFYFYKKRKLLDGWNKKSKKSSYWG